MKRPQTTSVLRGLTPQLHEHPKSGSRPPGLGVATLVVVVLTAGVVLGGSAATKPTPKGTQPAAAAAPPVTE